MSESQGTEPQSGFASRDARCPAVGTEPTLALTEEPLRGTDAPLVVRTLGEVGAIFSDQDGLVAMDASSTVYEIYGCAGEVEGPARLLYATTVLYPGMVGDEFFMTRGHFHTNPDRGEIVLTLSGQGSLILMDRERRTWIEPMTAGCVIDIDGRHAHRVANTGDEPLVFFVTWMSDCGHDYASIAADGFGGRLFRTSSGPQLVE